tara:strand:- start:110 stop:451 length:342 start_codon:yes stop_codon:yes gene_type:complete
MEIDHVAIQVDDIKESIDYYKGYGAKLIYWGRKNKNTPFDIKHDWAFLQFDNIKLALVSGESHPYHIAFAVDMLDSMETTKHRDGTESYYTTDPSGNKIEIIKYPEGYLEELQ